MASLKLACVVAVMCMGVVSAPIAQAAITCGQVAGFLGPCISYLRSGGAPPSPCCRTVKALNDAAKTTADRRTACKCLKSLAASISGVKDNHAAALPTKCRLRIPYKISTSTNCDTIR